ncbi:DmsC/YnfH family molybdoenzyme membrane anchor subunit [Xanthobacter sp. KR7-225]|uniref:dimethyl sulfoxide reductase anchor subunit family protein n=1 Tax=Xanthobacter sp. KR7-225 TaxID=3156613 RepID=UPI0032B62818
MHPAYSVIVFTTATGAGYGLLALLGLLAASGATPPALVPGLVSFGLAFALIGGGLLSSTGHLGRPERAWRAFSQWRSSWLSREGVAAVVTFVPAGLLALGWAVLGQSGAWIVVCGLLAAACAVVTVCSTAMIYASLKPIAQWHSRFTLPAYLLFAATSGLVLLNALMQAFGRPSVPWLAAALAFTALAWVLKIAIWRHNDALGMPATLNSATGLKGGTVRSVEWPHTEENYLLKEMGYRVARKHSARLRVIAVLLAFALPCALLAGAFLAGGAAAAPLSVLAAASQLAGLLVERWLFFAEAKHTVTLYYGLG